MINTSEKIFSACIAGNYISGIVGGFHYCMGLIPNNQRL